MSKAKKDTQIGKLYIKLEARTLELEKGINIAKKKIQELEQKNNDVKESNTKIEGSYLALSAVAVASLAKITSAIKSSIEEYNKYTQAMSSLKNVAEYTGQSLSGYAEIMEKYENFMTQSDMADTIKNFSLMGMTVEQVDQMMEALTNSAIRNRNTNYTVSQAVKVASDGYKQGLSTLSDSAGVTENLSVMLDKYAKSIGKTASQLTEAEKNQAYLNRTMLAAEPFASAMSEYMDTLAAKQGAYTQAMRDTQVAYGEAMEPVYSGITVLTTNILKGITAVIETFPGFTSGLTAGATAASLLTVGIIALTTAKKAWTASTLKATIAQKGLKVAMMSNPATATIVIITALVGATVGLITAYEKFKKKQEEVAREQEFYNKALKGTLELTDANAKKLEDEIAKLEEKKTILEQIVEVENENPMYLSPTGDSLPILDTTNLNELEETNRKIEIYNKNLNDYNIGKNLSNALDVESVRNKTTEAAKMKLNVEQNQKYLDILKKGQKGTKEYEEAQTALAKAYSETSTAEGMIIDETQKLIDRDKIAADSKWSSTQDIMENYIEQMKAAKNNEQIQSAAVQTIGESWDEILLKLENALSIYEILFGKKPSQITGIEPNKNSSSGTYKNDALENYKNQIEYKKNLDKINAKEEIKMYEYALNNLAKTNDEKIELEVKVYQLRKQLIEDFIEKEKQALDERTENSEQWIEEQNLSVQEQENAYNRIITYHKEYLDKMVADERLSLKQKEEIWKEEVNTIKEYQKQIREIKIEATNNIYDQLREALTKQADELQTVEENAINRSLESIENSKNKRIEMINEEYNTKIKAIDGEIKALEEAEKTKTRMEEQFDYEKQKKRLEELIKYEHDTVTKATYEKELSKLNSEYQNTLDKYALEDKKEALKNEKDMLKEEQQLKIDSINKQYENDVEYLNNRLEMIQENYDRERELADKNAQIMLLNTETHQNEIITLLKTYGDEYELLGTTWGEKVSSAFEEKVKGIMTTIENLNSQIDSAINNKIKQLSSATTSGMSSIEISNKKSYSEANRDVIAEIAKANNVDMGIAESIYNSSSRNGTMVIQNNTFNVPTEKPSTLLQKTQQTLKNLGELVRGGL